MVWRECQSKSHATGGQGQASKEVMNTDPLFQPFTLVNLKLQNRIVMAPMTRSKSPGGVPGPDVAAYYRRRAEGGVGLIVTEGTSIPHGAAVFYPDVPRFYGEDALAGWKWEPVVRALMALRGIQVLSGMTLIAEAGDLSRFGDPRSLMHFFGLTPSEHSSGTKRVQGGITKGGNAYCRHIMTEAAWHYRLKPLVSEAMQKRQEHQSKEVRLIAWKAQQRLHKRFRRLVVRKKSVVVATAIARELVGFVWAIACQVKPADRPPEPEIIRTCRGKVYVLDPNKKMPKTK